MQGTVVHIILKVSPSEHITPIGFTESWCNPKWISKFCFPPTKFSKPLCLLSDLLLPRISSSPQISPLHSHSATLPCDSRTCVSSATSTPSNCNQILTFYSHPDISVTCFFSFCLLFWYCCLVFWSIAFMMVVFISISSVRCYWEPRKLLVHPLFFRLLLNFDFYH